MKSIFGVLLALVVIFSYSGTPLKGQETQEEWIFAIHIGAQSLDRNNNQEEEINSMVQALCEGAPHATHFAFATHMDYTDQVEYWVGAIHNCGKKAWYRSAGFTNWLGHHGAQADGTPEQHLADMQTWIANNCSIFTEGDIFEPVPDEPSNGTYWHQPELGSVGGSQEARQQFNSFIQDAYLIARNAFDACGNEGVIIDGIHDSPSVIKDILDPATVTLLPWVGTDNYPRPEGENYTPEAMGAALRNELNAWAVGVHGNKSWCVTIGPSPYNALDEDTQAEALIAELTAVTDVMPDLRCITLWQAGDKSNYPNNRLLENEGSEEDPIWRARLALTVADEFIADLLRQDK